MSCIHHSTVSAKFAETAEKTLHSVTAEKVS